MKRPGLIFDHSGLFTPQSCRADLFDSLLSPIHTLEMRNFLSAVFILMGVGISTAEAASQKVFQSGSAPNSCKLAKFVGGKWTLVNEREVNGRAITNITASQANADFSNFKYQNTWFATRNDCIKDGVGIAGGSLSDTSMSGSMPYYVELKLQKYLIMGSNTGASTTTSGSVVATADAYASSIGFEGRFGYRMKSGRVVFLDIASLSAGQNIAYSGAITGTPKVSDSILKVNVGYQITFTRSSLRPYFAGSLGYAKLSGTIVGDVATSGGGGTLGVAYSASGFDLAVEGGILEELSSHWSVVESLGFTYLSLSPKIDQSNASGIDPLNSLIIARGYSHLTLAVGARYSF